MTTLQDPAPLFVRLLHFPVWTLGPGCRVGLWVQGCSLRCADCLTPESWAFGAGTPCAVAELADRVAHFFSASVASVASAASAEGVTLSGGEPFDQPFSLFALLELLREKGIRDVLLYSGYRAEVLLSRHPQLPDLAAALVDGPFERSSPTSEVWKGSENQSLTLWRPEFEDRYREWTRVSVRRLQWAKSGSGRFLVGIPAPEDVPRLKGVKPSDIVK